MRKSIWGKLFGSLTRLLLPVILLLFLAVAGSAFWLVHKAAEPPRAAYLVTPERLTQFTQNGAQFTDESWTNTNNTTSRGWLVKGEQNAPAVILLHRYGTDRSWLLNLGLQIQKNSNFTVLIPDLRGHGESPSVKSTAFGGCEAQELSGAIQHLRSLKTETNSNLIGAKIGVYGVEIGAITALLAAENSPEIAAIALDSVPDSSDELMKSVVSSRSPMTGFIAAPLASGTAPLYFFNGCYNSNSLCSSAARLKDRKIMLLAGNDAAQWRESTAKLANCFGNAPNVQKNLDLTVTGFNLARTSTPEQQIIYNNLVIDFFRQNLTNP